jgi:hypothetical protein
MKKSIILLAIALFSTFMACTEDTVTAAVTMRYQMTSCGDPWMRETNYQNDKANVLKQFLINKGVSVRSISITQDCGQAAVCLACICKGCDFATVEVTEDDVATMEGFGFQRQ